MRRARVVRRALALATIGLCAWLPNATAAPAVHLHATLTPERLGQGTTIGFSFQITTPTGQPPPPLTAVDVQYPVNLAFALSELGLARCTAIALELFGVPGCPPNSLMGYGNATAEIPFGPQTVTETAQVTLVRTTDQGDHIGLLVYAEANTPASTEIVIPALVLAAPPPYGGGLNMRVPLLESLPGAPDVSIVHLRATLGPQHLHYYEYAHGKRIKFQPKGVPLPTACPHGGFQFAAQLTFLDGNISTAHTAVPCPKTDGGRRR